MRIHADGLNGTAGILWDAGVPTMNGKSAGGVPCAPQSADQKNCTQGDLASPRNQRQALLHWAYDSRQY